MTIPNVSTPPTAPSRQDPSNFSNESDAFLAWWEDDFDPEINLTIDGMNTEVINVNNDATAAAASAQTAVDASASSAASANFVGAWNTLTGTLNIPASVSHSGEFWTLLNNVADVTATEPGVTGDWQQSSAAILELRVGSLTPLYLVRANAGGTALEEVISSSIVPDATETVKGKVELATSAETITGTDTGRVITPAGLQAKVSSVTAKGIVELATSTETITGTDTERVVTPAGLQARVATTTAKGLVELATSAEAITGSDTTRAITANGLDDAYNLRAAKIWGRFTQTTTSGTHVGISSITDFNTGIVDVNFDSGIITGTTYAVGGTSETDDGVVTVTGRASTYVRLVHKVTNVYTDFVYGNVIIHGV